LPGIVSTTASAPVIVGHRPRKGGVNSARGAGNSCPTRSAATTVKLGLHTRCPDPRFAPQISTASIHWWIFRHHSVLPFSSPLPPFPNVTGSPGPGVLRWLRPLPARSVAGGPNPESVLAARMWGEDREGPRVHCCSLDEGGAQMCPCGIATATPQHFTVASRQTSTRPPRSYPTSQNAADRIAHRNRPISARFGACKPLRDVEAGSCPYSFPSRSPDPHHLAVLTRPGFVRAAPTRTRHLTSHGCPQLHRPAATGSAVVVSTSTQTSSASRCTWSRLRSTSARNAECFEKFGPAFGEFNWSPGVGDLTAVFSWLFKYRPHLHAVVVP